MELKSLVATGDLHDAKCLNRTFMELKCTA